MKRILLIVSATLILALLAVSAVAEVAYQKEYIELILPDGWTYNYENGWYEFLVDGKAERHLKIHEHVLTIRDEENFVTLIAEKMMKDLEISPDSCELEMVLVNGQETPMTTVHKDGQVTYSAAVCYDRLYYIDYSDTDSVNGKANFMERLDALVFRPAGEHGVFRYGNAEVKLESRVSCKIKTTAIADYVLVEFAWKNVGKYPESFDDNVSVTLYQDGVQLKESVISESADSSAKILPGVTFTVTKAFLIRNFDAFVYIYFGKAGDEVYKWPEQVYKARLAVW